MERRQLTPKEELTWERIRERSEEYKNQGYKPVDQFTLEEANQYMENIEIVRDSMASSQITEEVVNAARELVDSFNHYDQIGREWEKTGFADALRNIVRSGSGKLD